MNGCDTFHCVWPTFEWFFYSKMARTTAQKTFHIWRDISHRNGHCAGNDFVLRALNADRNVLLKKFSSCWMTFKVRISTSVVNWVPSAVEIDLLIFITLQRAIELKIKSGLIETHSWIIKNPRNKFKLKVFIVRKARFSIWTIFRINERESIAIFVA